jgi:hypothetical protein
MGYYLKYYFALLLLHLTACSNEKCTSAVTGHQKKWDEIKTSARTFPASGLWLHRTNYPSKFSKYAHAYTGFEMDVNIDTAQMLLDVYHPPETSLNISVENFLKLSNAKTKYFWFDCKNLSKNNVAKALQILNQLDSLFQIKERIVFESSNAHALKQIAAAGYYCFYYLPIKPGTDLCNDTAFLTMTAALIDASFTAISADGRYIQTLNNVFPNCRKATWSLSPFRNLFQNEKNKMLKDTMIQVVLTPE